MIVHLPTVKQLQYLVALRRFGHFGKAADACFVTQSTLSAGLRELETLRELARNANARIYIGFDKHSNKEPDGEPM